MHAQLFTLAPPDIDLARVRVSAEWRLHNHVSMCFTVKMYLLNHTIMISFAADLSFLGDQAETYLENALTSAMALPELKGDSTRTVVM